MPQFPHWANARRQGKEVSPKAFLLRRSMIPGAHDGASQPGPDLRPLLSRATPSEGPRPHTGSRARLPGPPAAGAEVLWGAGRSSVDLNVSPNRTGSALHLALGPPRPAPGRCRDHTETRSSHSGTAKLHLRGVKGGHTAA